MVKTIRSNHCIKRLDSFSKRALQARRVAGMQTHHRNAGRHYDARPYPERHSGRAHPPLAHKPKRGHYDPKKRGQPMHRRNFWARWVDCLEAPYRDAKQQRAKSREYISACTPDFCKRSPFECPEGHDRGGDDCKLTRRKQKDGTQQDCQQDDGSSDPLFKHSRVCGAAPPPSARYRRPWEVVCRPRPVRWCARTCARGRCTRRWPRRAKRHRNPARARP